MSVPKVQSVDNSAWFEEMAKRIQDELDDGPMFRPGPGPDMQWFIVKVLKEAYRRGVEDEAAVAFARLESSR